MAYFAFNLANCFKIAFPGGRDGWMVHEERYLHMSSQFGMDHFQPIHILSWFGRRPSHLYPFRHSYPLLLLEGCNEFYDYPAIVISIRSLFCPIVNSCLFVPFGMPEYHLELTKRLRWPSKQKRRRSKRCITFGA